MKVELVERNKALAIAASQAGVLLSDITLNTALAETEKARVASIVSDVTTKAQVRIKMVACFRLLRSTSLQY